MNSIINKNQSRSNKKSVRIVLRVNLKSKESIFWQCGCYLEWHWMF